MLQYHVKMSAELDKRTAEWAVWFLEHRRDGMPLDKKIEFLSKSIEGLLELLAIATRDIQRLEHRSGNDEVRRQILLPRGVLLNSPLRAK